MTEHTPGPWEAYKTSPTDSHGWGVAAGSRGCITCSVAHEADARLIAAAPDLLAALEAWGQAVTSADGRLLTFFPGIVENAVAEAHDAARAAIAKARGE